MKYCVNCSGVVVFIGMENGYAQLMCKDCGLIHSDHYKPKPKPKKRFFSFRKDKG